MAVEHLKDHWFKKGNKGGKGKTKTLTQRMGELSVTEEQEAKVRKYMKKYKIKTFLGAIRAMIDKVDEDLEWLENGEYTDAKGKTQEELEEES